MDTVFVIAGIACALYGGAILMTSSGSWFFAFWFVLAVVLVALGAAMHLGWWGELPTLVKRALGGLAAIALIGFLATQVFIFRDFSDAADGDFDYVVVLGAQVRESGPSRVLRYRLDTAYDYLAAHEGATCIVSGGQGPNEPVPEAHAMADYLIARGLPEERILIEDESANTEQNLAYSARFLDPSSARVAIVTNNFHLARALKIARDAGYSRVEGIAAPSDAFFLPNNLTRESLALAKNVLT